MSPAPRLQPGRSFWLRQWLKGVLLLWLLVMTALFSWTMFKTGHAFSYSFQRLLRGSWLVVGLVGVYTLLLLAFSRWAQRTAQRNALERLSIRPGALRWQWTCWWRARPDGPLRHGLLALRGNRLYCYQLGIDRADESSVALEELRAIACLPPEGFRQWLFGAGRLRLFWQDGRCVDLLLPGAPRSLPILEKAVQEAA